MKDQSDSLNQKGITSTYIHSNMETKDYVETLNKIKKIKYKIIYVSPEKFCTSKFKNIIKNLNISMIAIDEAHCVSQWGHNFRPSYLLISHIISSLSPRPVVTAFTATATKAVQADIIRILNLNNPYVLTTGFDRANLKLSVHNSENKINYILEYLNNNVGKSGIIYCITRRNVDTLYDKLTSLNISVSKYHGGLSSKDRQQNQNDFIHDKTQIMIATNAFGMGIDKPNIRYVIHYNMPKDLEEYYQEIGRAGRDGNPAKCILLFSKSDVNINKHLINQISSPETRKIEYEKLNAMVNYCHTETCLRKYILEYFSEIPSFNLCYNCSNCNCSSLHYDITAESINIVKCIHETNEVLDITTISNILKGTKSSQIQKNKYHTLSTYGTLNNYTLNDIFELIYFLISENYLHINFENHFSLKICALSEKLISKKLRIYTRKKYTKLTPPTKERIFPGLAEDASIIEIMGWMLKKLIKYLL